MARYLRTFVPGTEGVVADLGNPPAFRQRPWHDSTHPGRASADAPAVLPASVPRTLCALTATRHLNAIRVPQCCPESFPTGNPVECPTRVPWALLLRNCRVIDTSSRAVTDGYAKHLGCVLARFIVCMMPVLGGGPHCGAKSPISW